jgi:molybdopterin molybdotransferase
VTTRGASVGTFDLVGPTLARLRFDAAFHKVRMRPGKATLFGTVGSLPVLGLPGNACVAMTAAMIFLRPALSLLSGAGRLDAILEWAMLAAPLAADGPQLTLLRGGLNRSPSGDLTFTVQPSQDNAMLSAMAAADALVVRPPSAAVASTRDSVEIIRLGAAAGF